MSDHGSYRIGEVAAATGVTVETLRFYERRGLLRAPLRSAGGARRYGEDVLDRVRFIRQAQGAGLTLRDIRVLVDSRRQPSRRACERTRAILVERLEDLERRLQEMRAFRDVLRGHVGACDRALTADTVDGCPAVEALGRG